MLTLEDIGVTVKYTVFDGPPPGLGFFTVIAAVVALATSVEVILAVTCELLTNVVMRALPFQLTTALEAKPVPFTVSVNAELSGATLAGTRG